MNDLFWLFTRFNKENNPEFNIILDKWTTESEICKANGKEIRSFKEYVNEWIENSNKIYTHDKFKNDIQDKKMGV